MVEQLEGQCAAEREMRLEMQAKILELEEAVEEATEEVRKVKRKNVAFQKEREVLRRNNDGKEESEELLRQKEEQVVNWGSETPRNQGGVVGFEHGRPVLRHPVFIMGNRLSGVEKRF